MLRSLDEIPMNTIITGKGNDSGPLGLVDQVLSGCGGLKLHEVDLLDYKREFMLSRLSDTRTGAPHRLLSTAV